MKKWIKMAGAGMALVLSLSACASAKGEVVANGPNPEACRSDTDKHIALSIQTDEDYTAADGQVRKKLATVCVTPEVAAKYPLGSRYP